MNNSENKIIMWEDTRCHKMCKWLSKNYGPVLLVMFILGSTITTYIKFVHNDNTALFYFFLTPLDSLLFYGILSLLVIKKIKKGIIWAFVKLLSTNLFLTICGSLIHNPPWYFTLFGPATTLIFLLIILFRGLFGICAEGYIGFCNSFCRERNFTKKPEI